MIWDYQRLLSQRLMIWAVASFLAGGLLLLAGDEFWRGFALQAAVWGLINAAIAVFGQRGARQKISLTVDLETARKERRKVGKILWVNTGLDLLYIGGGIALYLTQQVSDPFLAGTGMGILVQGLFLFVFDLLHALNLPSEYILPDLGLFTEPEHEPDTLPGSSGAILLVHGFPGSPAEMRGLGDALRKQGWTVRIMRLPGHGAEYREMFLQRLSSWEEAVEGELRSLLEKHAPVLLAGYSIGGALSACAAAGLKPDGLVLMAPFYFKETWLIRLVAALLRPWLPAAVSLFKGNRWVVSQLQAAARDVLPGFDFERADVRAEMPRFRFPLIFAEQFRLLSRKFEAVSSQLTMPVLIIQGSDDPLVRPQYTRAIAKKISPEPVLVEIPGDHNMNQPSNPAYPRLEQELLQFTQRFMQ